MVLIPDTRSFQAHWSMSRDHISKSEDYVWSVLILQKFSVTSSFNHPSEDIWTKTKYFINILHGSLFKDSLLIQEMTSETELELVCLSVCMKGGRNIKAKILGTKYLNLLPAFNYCIWRGQNHVLFSHFFHGSVIYCWKHIKSFVLWCNLCNLSKTILDLFHLLCERYR